MVNPGAFSGSRKEFLRSCKPAYAQAVLEGEVPEAISTIQRRYFLRYPIDLPHDVEPSAEDLASVDDNAAVPEPEGPNPDVMSLEDYAMALTRWEERQKLILFRKAQIRRWFAYQYMKDMDLDSTQSGGYNPFRALLFKLTGQKLNAPRQRSAANTWRKTQRKAIEEVVQARLKELAEEGSPVPKSQLIAFRDEIARKLFEGLSTEDQQHWSRVAIDEHKKAKKKWKDEMEGKIATDPVSRQIAIQGLIKFLQPILDLICEATGWKASLICGGPEPALQGLLNIISIHSGTTSGDVKIGFGKSERAQFRKVVVPLFGQFLQKCFTPVECRARALNKDQGFVPLSELDLENEGASVDLVSPLSNQPPPIRLGATPTSTSQVPAVSAAALGIAHPRPSSIPSAVRASASTPAPVRESVSTTATNEPHCAPNVQPAASVIVPPSTQPHRSKTRKSTVQIPPSPRAESPEATLPSLSSTLDLQVPAKAGEKQLAAEVAEVVTDTSGGDAEQGDNDEDINPFPYTVPVDSPQLPQAPLPTPSRNPSPLPSPCPSPPPSPAPISASNPSPFVASATESRVENDVTSSPDPTLAVARSMRSSRREGQGSTNSGDGAKRDGKRGKKRGFEGLPTTDNAGTISKRMRTKNGESAPSSSTFKVPDNAPDWFKKMYTMLSSVDLGRQWTLLIANWGRFEVDAGFAGQAKLGTTNRPQAIKDWIQRARSTSWRPNIRNAATFGSELKAWWVAIQPEWRVGENRELSKEGDGDWEGLRRPGINGLLSVVAALFFLGIALQGKDQDKHLWSEVVGDFEFVISHLAAR